MAYSKRVEEAGSQLSEALRRLYTQLNTLASPRKRTAGEEERRRETEEVDYGPARASIEEVQI